MMRTAVTMSALACAALVVAPATAQTQGDGEFSEEESLAKVRDLSKQGAARFRAGDYEEAIELFKKAYEVRQIGNLLYNIARCYESMEEHEKAIEYYERFIASPDADSESRQVAIRRSNEQREILAAKREMARQQDDQRDREPVASPPEATGGEARSGPGALAYITLGGGVAMLGGGALMGVLARNQQQTFAESSDPAVKVQARQTGQRQALVADVLYAAGGVTTLVGLIWVVRGGARDEAQASQESRAPDRSAPRARITPWASPSGGGGLTVMGRF